MKSYIVIGVFLATIAVVLAKSCHEEEDCDEGECCISGYIPFRKGTCRKLSTAGSSCTDDDDRIDFFGGKYYGYCPCEEGLECVTEEKESKWGKNKEVRKCREPATEEPETEAPEEPETEAPEEPETEVPEEPETEAPEEGGDGEGGEDTEGGEGEKGSEEVAEP